jgi:hypothetical protein
MSIPIVAGKSPTAQIPAVDSLLEMLGRPVAGLSLRTVYVQGREYPQFEVSALDVTRLPATVVDPIRILVLTRSLLVDRETNAQPIEKGMRAINAAEAQILLQSFQRFTPPAGTGSAAASSGLRALCDGLAQVAKGEDLTPFPKLQPFNYRPTVRSLDAVAIGSACGSVTRETF